MSAETDLPLRTTLLLSVCLVVSCASVDMSGTFVRVQSIEALAAAIETARPGTTIELARGEYNLKRRLSLSANGAPGAPVRLQAEDNAVRLTGTGSLTIEESSWLVVKGFVLEYEMAPLAISDSDDVRLSRLRFHYSPKSGKAAVATRTHWVHFRDGSGHRLDHSELGPHPGGLGVTVLVENAVRSIRIDHNHFRDRPRDGRNGAETIRLGSGGRVAISAVIEENLLENCNGESEIISIKSDGAIVRGNTFLDNHGQLVVRAGNDVTVEGNYFIAATPGAPVRGIRVHGENIRIKNNVFRNINGPVLQTFLGEQRASAARDSKPGAAGFETGYRQAVAVRFEDNVIFDDPKSLSPNTLGPRALIDLGDQRQPEAKGTLRPERWSIANNLFLSERRAFVGHDGIDFVWQENRRRNRADDAGTEAVECGRFAILCDEPWKSKERWYSEQPFGHAQGNRETELLEYHESLPSLVTPAHVGPGTREELPSRTEGALNTK